MAPILDLQWGVDESFNDEILFEGFLAVVRVSVSFCDTFWFAEMKPCGGKVSFN
jgi:hypothetical protein